MIKFYDITIEGFGSYVKPFKYKLGGRGINLILGHNGAGKSTILSALVWCLYGKTLKDKSNVTSWSDIQGNDFNGTKVVVRFKIGKDKVRIIRCKDYKGQLDGSKGGNRISISKGGDNQAGLRDKKDIQVFLTDLIGMPYRLFISSIIFGQNLVRLLKETGVKQKEIFDDAFQLHHLQRAKEKAKDDHADLLHETNGVEEHLKNLKSSHGHTQGLYKLEKERHNLWKQQKKETHDLLDQKILDLKDKIEGGKHLDQLIDDLTEQRIKVHTKVQKLKETENNRFKMELAVSQQEGRVQDLENELRRMMEEFTKGNLRCSECGQQLPKKQMKINLNRKKQLLKDDKEELTEFQNRQAEIDASILDMEKWKDTFDQITKSLENARIERGGYLLDLKLLTSLEKEQRETGDKPEFKLTELKSNLKSLKYNIKGQKKELTLRLKHLELLKWVIDKPLSNKGLKAYIFNSMLDQVNDQLHKYSQHLGYRVEFNIDLESSNKNFEAYIYQDDRLRPYEDLSGGQQQLVDICLAFAIHDVVNYTRNINILAMDEIFEHLDENNINLVSELVLLKSGKNAIHLMTHRSEFVVKSNRITTLSLDENGTSRVS